MGLKCCFLRLYVMPLRSQIEAKLRTRQDIQPEVRQLKPTVRVETVEITGRDPDSGLVTAVDQRGGIHQLNDLGAGSALGRVLPSIIVDGSPGAVNV